MHVYTSTNAIQPPTPPGFNNNSRDVAKLLLSCVSCCLFFGDHLWCILLSAASILSLKGGNTSSAKILKWMALSVISFMASLIAFVMKFELQFIATLIQVVWGAILGLFMISAYTATAPPSSSSLSPHQRKTKRETVS
jgi:hypothetical protein